jgi:hypothetical protein
MLDVFSWGLFVMANPGTLLLFAAVFGARSLAALSLWWGWPLMLSGKLTAGLVVLVYPLRVALPHLITDNISASEIRTEVFRLLVEI